MEERLSYNKTQHDELKQSLATIHEDYDKKLNDKQLEVWKADMAYRQLES